MELRIGTKEKIVPTGGDDIQLRDAEFDFVRNSAELTAYANMLAAAITSGQSFLVGRLDVSGDLPAQTRSVKGGGTRLVYANTKQNLFELETDEESGKTTRTDFVNEETGGVFRAGFSFAEVAPAPEANPDAPASTGTIPEGVTGEDEDEDEDA